MAPELPDDWTKRPLRRMAERIRRGLAGEPEHILMITSTAGWLPQSEKYNRFMAGESLKNYVELHEGEFSYNKGNSKTYPQGCVYQLEGWDRAAVPNVYISFALDGRQIDHGYASQFFAAGGLNRQLRRVITSTARSNGLLNIAIDDFFGCEVILPPLPEQRTIAAILSSVDDAIAATRNVIEQTERVKQGLLQTLMTRGIGHTRFKETEVGEVPEEWEVVRVGGLFERLRVPRTLDGSSRVEGGETPILDQSGSDWFGYHSGEADLRASSAEPLITFANHTCAVRFMTEPFSVIQNVFPLRALDDVDPRFLYWVMQQAVRQDGYRGHWPEVKRSAFPKPPYSEQVEIAERIDAAERSAGSAQGVLAHLQTLKRGLLQDLLTGRVRVQPD
ncbi:MAG: restriction endonuclease subunit S [Dehalococcoidia bacterium]